MTTIETGEDTVRVSYLACIGYLMFLFWLSADVGADNPMLIHFPVTGILMFTFYVFMTLTQDIVSKNEFIEKTTGISAGLCLSSISVSVMISVFLSLSVFNGFAYINPNIFQDLYRLNRFVHLLNTLTIILLSLCAFSNKGRALLRIFPSFLIGILLLPAAKSTASTSDADAGQPPTPSLTSEEQTTSTSDGGAGPPPTPSLTSEEQTTSDTQTSGVETERSPNTISGSDEEPDPHTVEITKEYDDD